MSLKRLEEGEFAQSDAVFEAMLATITQARPPMGETAPNTHVLQPAEAPEQAVDTTAAPVGIPVRSDAEPAVADDIRAVFAAVLGTASPNPAGAPSSMPPMLDPAQPATLAAARLNDPDSDPLQAISMFVTASSVDPMPTALPNGVHAQINPRRLQARVRHRGRSVALCVVGLAIAVLAGTLYASSAKFWLPTGFFSQKSGPDSQKITTGSVALPSVAVAAKAVKHPPYLVPSTRAKPPPQSPAVTPPTTSVLPATQATPIVDEADRLLQLGDIKAARDLLQTPAAARQPIAMLLLGKSYDPLLIGAIPNANAVAHAPTAISWYRRAVLAGNAGAARRHNALMQHILQN